jgi:hypothetical protein
VQRIFFICELPYCGFAGTLDSCISSNTSSMSALSKYIRAILSCTVLKKIGFLSRSRLMLA